MKTYKNLFDKICSFENLYLAYLKARKSKRYRPYVLEFSRNLEGNLLKLQYELQNQIYQHGGYREFFICDSKKRKIKAPSFRDRIIHHALCNVIDPIFDWSFIYDSYACRVQKGVHQAVKRLEYFLRSLNTKLRENKPAPLIFCLKCDISKYFENICHDNLFCLLKKKITDKKVLNLLKKIIDSTPGDKGIPIGNLTSQLFANSYLNELDRFIKHRLRIKYYIRYMDDFLILGPDKKHLHEDKERIKAFLRDRLKLELHPKKAEIFPIDKGVDFLGYVVRGNRRLLRKSTVKRFLKKRKRYARLLREGKVSSETIRNVHNSWRGYAKFADSYKLMKKLGLNKLPPKTEVSNRALSAAEISVICNAMQ